MLYLKGQEKGNERNKKVQKKIKNSLTSPTECDIIKTEKDKDSLKNQKGDEYGKNPSYYQGSAFRRH